MTIMLKNHRHRIKLLCVKILGNKCFYCGYDKCDKVFDFHHIRPKEKLFAISTNSYSYDKIITELRKCVLLCSNCHRELHANFIKIDNDVALLTTNNLIDAYLNNLPVVMSNINKCSCGKVISYGAKYCNKCFIKSRQHPNMPTLEVLENDIKTMSFVAVGKKYKVSDNTIRKWFKKLNMPQ